MALQDYAILKVFVNGDPLTQLTRCLQRTESGQIRVDILETGLAGWTPGSGNCQIELGYAVPIGGPEENFQAMSVSGEFVDFQMFQGKLTYTGRGKIMNAEVSQSVNAATEGSCMWEGEFKAFE